MNTRLGKGPDNQTHGVCERKPSENKNKDGKKG
jgi:hypothetical protein